MQASISAAATHDTSGHLLWRGKSRRILETKAPFPSSRSQPAHSYWEAPSWALVGRYAVLLCPEGLLGSAPVGRKPKWSLTQEDTWSSQNQTVRCKDQLPSWHCQNCVPLRTKGHWYCYWERSLALRHVLNNTLPGHCSKGHGWGNVLDTMSGWLWEWLEKPQ